MTPKYLYSFINFIIQDHNTRSVGKPRTRWKAIIQRDRLWKYENGGDEEKTVKNGGIF
jgi:hypothetical protein